MSYLLGVVGKTAKAQFRHLNKLLLHANPQAEDSVAETLVPNEVRFVDLKRTSDQSGERTHRVLV